jgi:hypothetical protein
VLGINALALGGLRPVIRRLLVVAPATQNAKILIVIRPASAQCDLVIRVPLANVPIVGVGDFAGALLAVAAGPCE